MNSLDDLFRAFGGPANLGRALGISTEHAAAMKRRRSIPVRYWLPLIHAARVSGKTTVTFETLTRLHAMERAAS